jgi:cystathionine beta-lyase/cystathionine gamma-synthase
VTFGFDSVDALNIEQFKGRRAPTTIASGIPRCARSRSGLAHLENAEMGLLFSSGAAAIAAVFLAHLEAGDHIVALHQAYGGTHDLLTWGASRFGWEVTLVDARNPETWMRRSDRGRGSSTWNPRPIPH